MKQATTITFLLMISILSFSQQSDPPATLTKQDFLAKSKAQKKAARILLFGGATLVLVAVVFPEGEGTGSRIGPYGPYESHKNDGVKAATGILGTVSMLASIPFFISGGNNKRKAAKVSFENRRVPYMQGTNLSVKAIPSLNLKISI